MPTDSNQISVSSLVFSAIALATGVCLVVLGYLTFFEDIHPEFGGLAGTKNSSRTFNGDELVPVSVSSYSQDGEHVIIHEFAGDQVVLASAFKFSVQQYPFITVKLDNNSPFLRAKLLWQTAGVNGSQSTTLHFDQNGTAKVFLPTVVDNVTGKIESFALLFYDGPELAALNNDGEQLTVKSINFKSWDISTAISFMQHRLCRASKLGAAANNIERVPFFVDTFSLNTFITLGIMAALVLLSLTGALIPHSAARVSSATVLSLLLLSFLTLEVARWHWRSVQVDTTSHRYAGLALEQRAERHLDRCADFPSDCAAHLFPYF